MCETPDSEQKALELAKLRLEVDGLRRAADREALELQKLRADVADAEKAPQRNAIATATPVLAAIATVIFGVASCAINASINRATDRQREFENYTRLTEDFAKGGTVRTGAVADLSRFLSKDSDRAQRTAAILVGALSEDRDAINVRTIEDALLSGPPTIFQQVREEHLRGQFKLRRDAFDVLRSAASAQYYSERQHKGTAWASFINTKWMPQGALTALFKANGEAAHDLYERRIVDDAVEERSELEDLITKPSLDELEQRGMLAGSLIERGPIRPPQFQHMYWRYVYDAQAFAVTANVLRSFLNSTSFDGRGIDASGISIAGVRWVDRDFSYSFFQGTIIAGDVSGANFYRASFHDALLDVKVNDPTSGQRHMTSFCGADLSNMRMPRQWFARFHNAPDFTAADWWDIADLSQEDQAFLEVYKSGLGLTLGWIA